MSRAFTDSMADFSSKILNDAIERLAAKYGFDAEEASELSLIRREDGEFKYNVEICKGEFYVTLNK